MNKKTNDDEYDDCPLCQMMKKAEEEGQVVTLSDTKKAFKEAEKQGAIVGGSLMEEDNTSKSN